MGCESRKGASVRGMSSAAELVAFEKSVEMLWEKGKIDAPVHFCGGNEEQLLAIFELISPEDYVFSTHRNHYHYLLHTGKWDELLKEICNMGGLCRGNSRSMHTTDVQHRFYSSAIVAGMVAIAAGVAYALKLKKSKQKVWCFIGDGAADSGFFFEALRYAVGQDLPITYVIEDNDRSVCTCKKARWGDKDRFLCELAEAPNPKVMYYHYRSKYPHVGTGRPIEW